MIILNKLRKHKLLVKIISGFAVFAGIILIVLAVRGGQAEEAKGEIYTPKVELVRADSFLAGNSKLSLTGSVESTDSVELKSQMSAKVKNVNIELGDNVYAGQTLVSFENDDIWAQVLQAQAGLESAQARLEEMKQGAREEEIAISQAQVKSAEDALKDAQTALENTETKAETDLQSAYISAVSVLTNAASGGKSAVELLSDIQLAYFNSSDIDSLNVQEAKRTAVLALFDKNNAGRWQTNFISQLDSGVYGRAKDLSSASDYSEIDQAVSDMNFALSEVKNALAVVPVGQLSAYDKTSLAGQRNSVDGQISAVLASGQGVATQKIVNNSLISAAKSGIIRAENALTSAQSQFALVLAGATDSQIKSQEAQVKLASAGLSQAQAAFNKTVIRAPISGVIASLPVKRGELVNPGQTVASIVNLSGFEVKTYVDAENLKYLNVGSKALVEGETEGVVSHIAPAIDSASKKVEIIIAVSGNAENKLVDGQYVNLNILLDENGQTDSYIIPLEAIKTKAAGSVVYLVDKNSKIAEQPVVLGEIIGESVEIIDGLSPEMEIVSNVRGLENGEEVEVKD